ncbi:hypothetical protein GCM10010306_074980 [Streptomyces umbrinus]|nr:hypothetical protein GCM10010306_074980 [Streptomyces umbrinus]
MRLAAGKHKPRRTGTGRGERVRCVRAGHHNHRCGRVRRPDQLRDEVQPIGVIHAKGQKHYLHPQLPGQFDGAGSAASAGDPGQVAGSHCLRDLSHPPLLGGEREWQTLSGGVVSRQRPQ